MDSKVNDNFLILLNKMYGTHGELKATCGTFQEYLVLKFYLSETWNVKFDMIDYMDAMFDNFSTKFKPDDTSPNPESEDLFVYGTTADLDTQKAAESHTFF